MPFSALLIGDSTLLIRCAEHLLSAGHTVQAVVTRHPQISTWCDANGIVCLQKKAVLTAADLEGLAPNFLFSIANLEMLPMEVVGLAGRAFNFHDGPLPHMAGLNAPVWAVLSGATSHGVTWHEITAQADGGRIAVEEAITLSPDETTFSLNTKCYEAGLASFERLVERLDSGALELRAQMGTRSYFRRSRRPALGGVIDPAQPARDGARLVAALDHGRYWNPVTCAKVIVGHAAFAVRNAEPVGAGGLHGVPVGPPGRILARDPQSLTIATAEGALKLGGLAALDGRTVDPTMIEELAPGCAAGMSGAAQKDALAAASNAAGRSEYAWLAELAMARQAVLPYPTLAMADAASRRGTARRYARIAVVADIAACAGALGCTQEAALLTGLAVWLSRLGCGRGGLVGVCTARTAAAVAGVEAVYRPDRPLVLADDSGATGRALATGLGGQLVKLEEAGPVARDLALRLEGIDAPVKGLPEPVAGLAVGQLASSESGLAGDGIGLAPVLLEWDPQTGRVALAGDTAIYQPATLEVMARHVAFTFDALCAHPDEKVARLPFVPALDKTLREALNRPQHTAVPAGLIDDGIANQMAATPDRVALRWHSVAWSYRELGSRVEALTRQLARAGARRGSLVAVSLERTPSLVVTLLAVLRTGAGYVPIDPRFPKDRIELIRRDCGAGLMVTDQPGQQTSVEAARGGTIVVDAMGRAVGLAEAGDSALPTAASRSPADLAYLTYTSGSTGRPKGVCVTHANVSAFFAGMDERVPHDRGGTWLAVTSISFDISVLELLWTLSRGFTVALNSDIAEPVGATASGQTGGPTFSLFYFAAAQAATGAQGDTYRLLLEGARFADANGFEAVWTPERHFHAFGGIYPNPAVTGAAVAAITRNVAIRAGSCVLPLHDPLRVAEDWSLVDNLSGGRAGVAFAAGWMPDDFVLRPEAYATRKALMLEHIDTIDRLWRGETIERARPTGGTARIGTLPRPVQQRLPVWLTAARNPETFDIAGKRGWNVLTHLLGMSVEELQANIARYRAAWRDAGHAGQGRVTLMLHTFVGDDERAVRETVRAPMKAYLASALDIVRAADWNFPTIIEKGKPEQPALQKQLGQTTLSAEDQDALLEHAFDRYFRTSGLFGTPETCAAFASRLGGLGVDELACLVDFGVDQGAVLDSLPLLADAMNRSRGTQAGANLGRASVANDIVRYEATHFQCTPSMAAMLLADRDGEVALSRLDAMLVGGEALPKDMAQKLVATVPGPVLNMYGPTETTVWSTTARLDADSAFVSLGTPIAGTAIEIADETGAPMPALVPGELLIAGAGVAQGYWQRPDLTAERFIMRETPEGPRRFYRTGDLVRQHGDGQLEYLGRIDQQIKLRGHRIELGEIEATLAALAGVGQAVVVARVTGAGAAELAGFVTPAAGSTLDPSQLVEGLKAQLPAIMVPASLTVLDRLPLTANGKTDRKALAERTATKRMPAAAAPSHAAAIPAMPAKSPAAAGAPADLEHRISAVWCRLLGLETVGRTQNFFDLGGHSLLAVQLHRALQSELSADLKLTDIFRFPTVASLASHLGTSAPSATVATEGRDRARLRLEMSRRGRGTAPQSRATDTASGGSKS